MVYFALKCDRIKHIADKGELGVEKSGNLIKITLILLAISRIRNYWLYSGGGVLDSWQSFAVFAVYFSALFIWRNSIKNRIVQKSVRFFLLAEYTIMAGWTGVRFLQSLWQKQSGVFTRYIGYLFVIPIVFLPLFGFFASLLLGKGENGKLPVRMHLLFIPAGLLSIFMLTNDMHHLCFKLSETTPEEAAYFTPAAGFAVIVGWAVLMEAAKIRNIIMCDAKIKNGKLKLLPPAVLLLFLLYMIPFALNSFGVAEHEPIEFTMIMFLDEIAIWESCVITGILPINTRYREIFMKSDIAMQILNPDGTVFAAAENATELLEGEFEELVKNGTVERADNTRIKMKGLDGGYVLWQTDMTEIRRMLEELYEKREELSGEELLVRKELANNAEMRKLEERSRVYELIYRETEEKRQQILRLLDEIDTEKENEEVFANLFELATEVKNRANALIEGQKETADA